MKKNWYVVYTKARNEKKAALLLEKSGIDVYCPTVKEVRQWSDRKKTVEVPLFSSYLFVHLAPKERELVYAAPGVVRYLFWLNRPAIVKDQEIETLKKMAIGRGFVCKGAKLTSWRFFVHSSRSLLKEKMGSSKVSMPIAYS